jgi:hypothetical protein
MRDREGEESDCQHTKDRRCYQGCGRRRNG